MFTLSTQNSPLGPPYEASLLLRPLRSDQSRKQYRLPVSLKSETKHPMLQKNPFRLLYLLVQTFLPYLRINQPVFLTRAKERD
uniref:Uncharacterized protein n=1 Tax=uncultured marine virus TaxID=186617 RepID=A0A0F7L4Q7_9VIRU|nr:hypothetical protein [uncultured marine virus]